MFCHKFSDNFNECKSVCKEEIFGPCEVLDEGSSSGTISASFSETGSHWESDWEYFWDDHTNPYEWSYADSDSNDPSDSNDSSWPADPTTTTPTPTDEPTENSEGSGTASETGSGCVEWASDNCHLDKSCWVSEPMAHLDGGKIRHDLLCGRLAHTPRVDTPGRDEK